MIRRMIEIDEALCNGCGLCANACQEGAIAIIHGKAKLVRDDYCDGLGNCLPVCPTGAISFVEREAVPFDEEAVKKHLAEKEKGGCPGSRIRVLHETPLPQETQGSPSMLRNWPVQLKLAPVRAPYFAGAKLLIAADCSAFACGSFHQQFLRGRTVLVGCPKLDMVDYREKLEEICKSNEIADITVVRMEVPCCGGLERAVKEAIAGSGKEIPLQVITLSVEGTVLEG